MREYCQIWLKVLTKTITFKTKHMWLPPKSACSKPETPQVGLGDPNPYKNEIRMNQYLILDNIGIRQGILNQLVCPCKTSYCCSIADGGVAHVETVLCDDLKFVGVRRGYPDGLGEEPLVEGAQPRNPIQLLHTDKSSAALSLINSDNKL